jgi:type 1 fimbria pilin
MKRILVGAAGLVLCIAGLSSAADDDVKTYRGEVADSQCALNVHSLTHSHQEMLKSKSMGGDSASCARYCTTYLGGTFVLSVKKDIYHLDDQDSVRRFAGRRVKVSGTLDPKSKTIHVVNVEADE